MKSATAMPSRLEQAVAEGKVAERLVGNSDVIESNLRIRELEKQVLSEREKHRLETDQLKVELHALRAVAEMKAATLGGSAKVSWFPGIYPSRLDPHHVSTRTDELIVLNNNFVNIIRNLEVRIDELNGELSACQQQLGANCPHCGQPHNGPARRSDGGGSERMSVSAMTPHLPTLPKRTGTAGGASAERAGGGSALEAATSTGSVASPAPTNRSRLSARLFPHGFGKRPSTAR